MRRDPSRQRAVDRGPHSRIRETGSPEPPWRCTTKPAVIYCRDRPNAGSHLAGRTAEPQESRGSVRSARDATSLPKASQHLANPSSDQLASACKCAPVRRSASGAKSLQPETLVPPIQPTCISVESWWRPVQAAPRHVQANRYASHQTRKLQLSAGWFCSQSMMLRCRGRRLTHRSQLRFLCRRFAVQLWEHPMQSIKVVLQTLLNIVLCVPNDSDRTCVF